MAPGHQRRCVVSRVGGAAQIKAMKEVAGSLRLDLSQYRELEAFAAFASDLDATSKAQLGAWCPTGRVAQAAAVQPLSVERPVVAVFLGTNGGIWISVPVETSVVSRRSSSITCARRMTASSKEIRESQKLSDELDEKLTGANQPVQEGLRGLRRQLGRARRACRRACQTKTSRRNR